jgi:predicted P-loop ATPase
MDTNIFPELGAVGMSAGGYPGEAIRALRQRLYENGYRPLPVYNAKVGDAGSGKRPTGHQWQDVALRQPPVCTQYPASPDALNTGVLCTGLRVVDLDIDDEAMARACAAIARKMLGRAPIRWRAGSARCLLPYRAATGEPPKYPSLTGKAHSKADGVSCKVEVLGAGQQFVACGMHHSGAALEWDPAGLLDIRRDDLTAVTEAQIEAFMLACAAVIGVKVAEGGGRGHGGPRVPGEPQAELERLGPAVAVIPNDGPADWDAWNRMAMALWAATGGGDDGRVLFHEWSAKNEGAYDEEFTEEKWDHLFYSPPKKIGAGSLFYEAKQHGWINPKGAGAAKMGQIGLVDFAPPIESEAPVLRHTADTIRKLIEETDKADVARLFIAALVGSDIDPLVREEFYGLVAKKTKAPKAAVRNSVKKAERILAVPYGDWQRDIQRNEKGEALGNLANATTFLRNAPELVGMVSYDEMMRSVYLNHRVPEGRLQSIGGTQQDEDVSEIQEWIQRHGVVSIRREVVQQAVNLVARERSFHPLRDYLNGLQWDGVERVSNLFGKYLGAKEQPVKYLTAISRFFMLSMIYRIMEPGCQCDYMIVLEGPQGKLKTTACNILAGDWFSNSMPDVHGTSDDVRISMHLRGKWLIEIGELSSFRRSEIEKLKNFLTRRVEDYVPKHGYNEVHELRQCVFVGTTNEKTYLKDPTGARRFWPVRIGDILLALLVADRDQLFAEAMCAYRVREQYWPDREFEAAHIKPQQDARFEVDAWEAPIAAWLESPGSDFSAEGGAKPKAPVTECTTGEVAGIALKLDASRQNQETQKRIAGVMKRLGWAQRRFPAMHWFKDVN